MARRRSLSGLFIARLALCGLGAVAAPAALVMTPATVLAQTPPQVTSAASETEVEVGESFSIQLNALSETREEISNPELRPPAGFSMSGPLISTQRYRQDVNGVRKVFNGIGASWTLVASAPGNYTIAAPSVTWNGRRLAGTPATIKVLPQGSKPRAPVGGFLFPAALPAGIFGPGGIFGGAPNEADVDDPNDEPNLALSRATNTDVFLHASVDKTRAVVGEQVTVSVYRYFVRGAYADINERVPMRFEDFLRYSLIGDPGVQTTRSARAGDRRFFVRLIEKYAIFPLHTGKLKTGAAIETYQPWNRRGTFRRLSEDLAIDVSEPPAAGKPTGYRLGDVGQFQISALVQPRRIEEGGSVAVTVKVTGTGNFPTSLSVPEKTGIEWLDPEKKETIEPRNGELSGYRSFGYVVRVTKKGTVDLGTIDLPYWNPKTRKYEVARSALGSVDVTPGATVAPSSSTPIGAMGTADDPFVNMPAPRAALAAFVKPGEQTLLQGPRFYVALAAPPLLALAGIAAASLAKRTRARIKGRKTSLRTLAATALAEAKRAKKAGDERAAAAAVERAVVLAIEDASGVKARGLLKEALADELMASGVAEGPALRARDVLSACEKARFDPLAAADVSIDDAETLVAELVKAKSP